MSGQLVPWQKQPGDNTVVWQSNQLAEARYELSPREQKLVLYVISMIEPEDDDFKRYVVNVADFAKLAKLSKSELYRELRDLAENLKSKVLVIPNHLDPDTGKHVDLVTSWFSDALITANGQGYFAVEISRNLKPYLLKVKREFFRFRLQQVMQMRSAYAIGLYQFAKRWEFKRRMVVSVVELRGIMGAVHPAGRGKTKTTLGNYADFKRRGIQPAVDEINEKSDIFLGFTEIKAKGSKAVESLELTIAPRANPVGIETLALPVPPQMELGLDAEREADQEEERTIGIVKAKYGLSQVQAEKVRKYYRTNGAEYVAEKTAVVDQEKRDNVARALLAALRDDWQPSRKTRAAKPQVPSEKPGETSGKFAAIKAAVAKKRGGA
ncbi:MAG: replication initiation protein [Rhodospirillales bacterium]|nr:replication initiation protein [Acetobacter sp.]